MKCQPHDELTILSNSCSDADEWEACSLCRFVLACHAFDSLFTAHPLYFYAN